MMPIIEIAHLTKDYGHEKGVFDINLTVEKGEIFGFLGLNGAGKTTTIRNLLGFIRPGTGTCNISGMDCFQDAPKIQQSLGYLAGELTFLEDMAGKQMIEFIAAMKGITNKDRMYELMKRFELDPSGRIKKMSKGMKQKIGIVCAFMGDPDILILDEPTSGLDPLMQNKFVELLLEEKKKGKTIFMSSHIFEEVEKTCDRTAIIRQGKIVTVEGVNSLKKKKQKSYTITFREEGEVETFRAEGYEVKRINGLQVTVAVKGDVDIFLKTLAKYSIQDVDTQVSSLEEIFLHYYGGEKS